MTRRDRLDCRHRRTGLFLAVLLVPILAGLHVLPANAQSNSQLRRDQLLRIAEIMGAVHYLHGQCDRNDNQTWRNNMARLIELEQPTQETRTLMIERFNAAYETQRQRFRKCNKKRAREAARLAQEGELLAADMARRLAR